MLVEGGGQADGIEVAGDMHTFSERARIVRSLTLLRLCTCLSLSLSLVDRGCNIHQNRRSKQPRRRQTEKFQEKAISPGHECAILYNRASFSLLHLLYTTTLRVVALRFCQCSDSLCVSPALGGVTATG